MNTNSVDLQNNTDLATEFTINLLGMLAICDGSTGKISRLGKQ
jgi:hypothetical protein